jgi:hypothetical protein
MSRPFVLLAIAGALVMPAVYSVTRPDPEAKAKADGLQTLVSDPYRLDKIYRSMEGPWSIQSGIHLAAGAKSGVLWVTGLETEVVDATAQKPISSGVFLSIPISPFAEHGRTPLQYNQQLGGKTHLDWRLFTLVPGRSSIELPPGFGVPIPSDAALDYVTMSLNLNERDQVVNVRMRTKVHTIAADQPGAPTKGLFRRALYVLQPHGVSAKMGPGCMAKAGMHMGAGCAELSKAEHVRGSECGETRRWPDEPLDRPSRSPHLHDGDYATVESPFDTTIHYATMHVHPFARGMELRDLTTGTTIFRLNSQDWPDRVGVAYVEEFKSIEGIPIQRDHRYELSAEYDNPLKVETDAMAIPLPLLSGKGSDVIRLRRSLLFGNGQLGWKKQPESFRGWPHSQDGCATSGLAGACLPHNIR